MGHPSLASSKSIVETESTNNVSFLSGALYDATGNHDAGFSFAGFLFLCSSLTLLLLPWVKYDQDREGERMPLRGGIATTMESEFGPQSALMWPGSLPPYEEFILQNDENVPFSMPPIPNASPQLTVTRLTRSPRW